jgi:hypothetical protein
MNTTNHDYLLEIWNDERMIDAKVRTTKMRQCHHIHHRCVRGVADSKLQLVIDFDFAWLASDCNTMDAFKSL